MLIVVVLFCYFIRSKNNIVVDDNCCMCHVAGVKYLSEIRDEDVLIASFKNHVFEVNSNKIIHYCH